ncbi:MAG: zinc-dependent peptidase [Comamonas sp.]
MWLERWRARAAARRKAIPEALWAQVLQTLPFLLALDAGERTRLRLLCSLFLDGKEFSGANGLVITDRIAVLVAAQACLPLLHIAPPERPWQALAWYDDFVGIVIQPAEVRAHRTAQDDDGVVHHYDEIIDGEAMDGGPVMLGWHEIAQAGERAEAGCNLVIHEFIHKMDMRDGAADGCPPLPAGFRGHASPRAAYEEWHDTWQAAYDDFGQQVVLHERFGAPPPWLDPYAAEAPEEFFAVACEAYFVNRAAFARHFAALLPLLDAFFLRHVGTAD